MAGYCTSVRLYFHEPQASENTAQECWAELLCKCWKTLEIGRWGERYITTCTQELEGCGGMPPKKIGRFAWPLLDKNFLLV